MRYSTLSGLVKQFAPNPTVLAGLEFSNAFGVSGRLLCHGACHNLMKHISRKNYQSDKYYRRIVRAVDVIVEQRGFVAPIDLFREMDLLENDAIVEWRAGRLPFLERAIRCNLACASRILRILRLHALDLNLRPSQTGYVRKTRNGRRRLRFTKTGEPALEQAYARHFVKTPAKSERVSQESANSVIDAAI